MDLQSLFRYPIIQAPMAGGACTPELVAEVSKAGGLGSLAGSLLSPETIAAQVEQVRSMTDRPFLVNLFVQP
ncbi:MAG TPA: nitronate monooxygenase, partial [Telluria sp.]|nr:nitronate monooxygenase [Telluria sp.]